MSDSQYFRLGERAGLVKYEGADFEWPSPANIYFGQTVIVDSAPVHSWEFVGNVGYWIVTRDGKRFSVGAVCLRKISEPQDWVKLCKLNEIPINLTVEV